MKADVAVLLCVNRLDSYLKDAIESVLNQSDPIFKFYIIANNCEDDLWDYLLSVQENDVRVVLARTGIGQLPYNLNYGLDLIDATYVMRMDSDDISRIDRMKYTKQLIKKWEGPDLIAGSVEYIDEYGVKLEGGTVLKNSGYVGVKSLFIRCQYVHPAVTFKKEAVMELGGYLGGFKSEDYDLWLRARRHGGWHVVEDSRVILDYRISSTQTRGHRLAYSEVASYFYREWLYVGGAGNFLAMIVGGLKVLFRVKKDD